MEFLGWWAATALLVLLVAREMVWRRRMHGVINGVRALREELIRSNAPSPFARPWTPPGQVSEDTRTSVRRPDPPPPVG
jgi:hypothetical protein